MNTDPHALPVQILNLTVGDQVKALLAAGVDPTRIASQLTGHAAFAFAHIEPPETRAAAVLHVQRTFAALVDNLVQRRHTTAGGVIVPQPGNGRARSDL